MADKSVRSTLARCIVDNDRENSRVLLLSLLNESNNNADSLDKMKNLLVEVALWTLHGSSAAPAPQVAKPSAGKKQGLQGTENKKPSLVGTVSLPRPSLEGQAPKEGKGSGSDIPSSDSADSEDEQSDNSSAAEQWRQTLRDFQAERGTTHKDFFDSLIHDISEQKDFHASQREPHPEDRLELVSGLQRQVEEVVHRTLDEAEKDFAAQQADAPHETDGELVLDGALLDEVCTEVLAVITADGSFPCTHLDTQLSESLSFLYYQPVNTETRLLLLQAIEIELHDHAVRMRDGLGEEPGEDLDALNARELDQKDGLSAGGASGTRAIVYDDSSSTSSEPPSPAHSPAVEATSAPQATPSARAGHARTPAKAAVHTPRIAQTPCSDPTEGVPAWDLPRSPLDPLFRKGYGGLGQSDLREVMDLLTPRRRAGLQAEAEGEAEEDEGEEEGETSDGSSQQLVQSVHTPGPSHPLTATSEEVREEEEAGLGLDDLPDPDTFARATPLRGAAGRLQRYLAEACTTVRVHTLPTEVQEESVTASATKKMKKKLAVPAAQAAHSSPTAHTSRLAKKAANGQALRSAPGRLAHTTRTSDAAIAAGGGDSHVRAILLDDEPPLTHSAGLNALMQQSFQRHVERHAGTTRGAQVAYSPTGEKMYAFDEEARQDDSDASSIDTEDYQAFLSSQSSPGPAHAATAPAAAGKKKHKKKSGGGAAGEAKKARPKKRQSEPLPARSPATVSAPARSQTPKKKPSGSGPGAAGAPARPASAGRGRVGGASTESRLLEPTAASKRWARK